ncbi:MAG: FkbM family methyltransferase [Rhodospirillaceae bacterium]|nr:FkbM family methyltransferase [Rhodospirillaceae bacterium]
MKFKYGLAFPDADAYLFDRMPKRGVWQDDAFQAGLAACKNFRIAIDGGAHIGTWSLALADKFERVIAFEPAQDTFAALQMNVARSTASAGIEIHNKALGNRIGTCKMAWTKKDRRRFHTGARYVKKGGHIPRLTIDSLELKHVDFIKLDLEGGEPDALEGAYVTLLKWKPIIVFEDKGFCSRYNRPADASRSILTSMNAHEIIKCGINRVWGWG